MMREIKYDIWRFEEQEAGNKKSVVKMSSNKFQNALKIRDNKGMST